jgi:hypothetical protein
MRRVCRYCSCGVALPVRRLYASKYCSQKCKRAAVRRMRKPCLTCGKRCNRSDAKYCSISCGRVPGPQQRRNLLACYAKVVRRGGAGAPTLEEFAYYYECKKSGIGAPKKWKSWTNVRTPPPPKSPKPPKPDGYYGALWSRRYRDDPTFMVWERQRNQFKKWMKGERLTNTLARTVGYTRAELRAHIERQFVRGMGWHNYGKWHIDHIVPKRLFDPGVKSEMRACWALWNLRPLWKGDNQRKHARVTHLL